MPVYAPATCWAAEAVASLQVHVRPWRLVELDLVDLPGRHAPVAPKIVQRGGAAAWQTLGRLDLQRAETAAYRAVPSLVGAPKPCAGELASPQPIIVEGDPPRRVTARAGDVRLKAKVCDFPESGKGQRVEHPPRLDRR